MSEFIRMSLVGASHEDIYFPRSGSQSKVMGGDLFDTFVELTQKADDILGYSIKALCLENANRELNKTQFTQPALYVVNALSYYRKLEETGRKPDYVAGHSLKRSKVTDRCRFGGIDGEHLRECVWPPL